MVVGGGGGGGVVGGGGGGGGRRGGGGEGVVLKVVERTFFCGWFVCVCMWCEVDKKKGGKGGGEE